MKKQSSVTDGVLFGGGGKSKSEECNVRLYVYFGNNQGKQLTSEIIFFMHKPFLNFTLGKDNCCSENQGAVFCTRNDKIHGRYLSRDMTKPTK